MAVHATQSPAAALLSSVREAARLAWDSLRSQPARSGLAIAGVVIGIVTVVLVASVLVGLRNSVAQLFPRTRHRQHLRVPPQRRSLHAGLGSRTRCAGRSSPPSRRASSGWGHRCATSACSSSCRP